MAHFLTNFSFKSVIARKLIIGLFAFSSSVTIVLTSLQLYHEYQFGVNKLNASFIQIRKSYLKPIENGLWELDGVEVETLLRSIVNTQNFVYAAALVDGKVKWSQGKKTNDNIKTITENFPIKRIYNGDQIELGELQVIASLENIYQKVLDDAVIILGSNALKTFLIAIFLFFLIHFQVTRHLTALTTEILENDSGENAKFFKLDRRRNVENRDELDILVDSLNHMKVSRERAEAEHKRLLSIIETTPDLVGIIDKNEFILYLNKAGRKLIGFEENEDLTGTPLASCYSGDVDQSIMNAGMQTAIREGEWHNETSFLSRTGRKFITSQIILAHKMPDGKVDYFSTVARDITTRIETEEKLRKSETSLMQAQAIAHIGSWELDIETGDYRWSDEVYRILGFKPQEFVPSYDAFLGSVPPNDRNFVMKEMNRAVKDGSLYSIEHHIVRPNGEELTVYAQGKTYINKEGNSVRMIGTIQDITEHKQMLYALRESEDRFYTLARVSPVGIFQTDTEGLCKYANQRWHSITGMDAKQAQGHNWANALHPQDKERVFSEWLQATKNNKPFKSEYRFRRPDGTAVWVYGQASSVYDKQGELTGYVGTITDISERKQVEQELLEYKLHLEDKVTQRTDELKQINDELEAFSYSVSHDLRTPLRSIDGFSLALIDDYADQLDDTAINYLRRIRLATHRMGNLIDDLLMLSRTNRGEIKFEKTDLSVLANSVVNEFQQAGPERQIEVIIAQGVCSMGDQRLLTNVFENLFSNAWKFTKTKQHPLIEFGYEPQGNHIICYIKDNGAGFNMKYSDKMFNAFQRLHTAKEYPGTGVGLAIVQRIIHRHGGKVWAEAKEGEGATFFFTLPAVVDDNAGAS